MSWTRLLMIAPFFLWGSAMVVMRDALTETTPLFVAVMRLLPAGILVLMARRMVMGQPVTQPASAQPELTQSDSTKVTTWFPRQWQGWAWLLAFALIDATCFQGFLAQGLTHTGAGLGSVLIDSQPLAVALMAMVFYQERLGWWGWGSLALGLLGIGMIGLSSVQGSAEVASGAGWMLLSALSMAVGTVMVKQVSRYWDPVWATGWHMVLGSLPLVWLSFTSEQHQWDHLSSWHWLGLLYASVLGSAVAYGLFFYFAAQENLTAFSSLTFLTPVFALLLGSLFLGESLTFWQWAGVGITLLSVYGINQRQQLAAQWPTWSWAGFFGLAEKQS
ncbi:MAG: DMT family transporter [Synechococcales cyanobacterium]